MLNFFGSNTVYSWIPAANDGIESINYSTSWQDLMSKLSAQLYTILYGLNV